MRKINGKLFLILLLGTATLVGAVFLVHHFQYRRIGDALLWQACRAEEQGKPRRMTVYLQRYLEFSPHDLDQKAKLARTWAGDAFAGDLKARRNAVNLLEEVLRSDDDPELRRLLVKLALELPGKLKQARDHLARLLPWREVESRLRNLRAARADGGRLPASLRERDKPRGELEGFWGQVLEAEGKDAEALGCYRLAVGHAPREQSNYVRLAYLLRKHKEDDQARRKQNCRDADRVIDDLVARNKPSHKAYLARWRYRRDFDLLVLHGAGPTGSVPLADAAEDVAAALRHQPNEVEVRLAAADLERLRGREAAEKLDLSVEEREKLMEAHRKQAFAHLERGLELVAKQNGVAAEQGRFDLLWHKANLLLDDIDRLDYRREATGKQPKKATQLVEDVQETIGRLQKTHVPAAADYLRGRLLIHERRWADAATLLERARALMGVQRDLAAQASLYLGQCYERLEEHKLMYDAYKLVADWDPNSSAALLGKAAARWSQGQLDEANTLYLDAVRRKGVPPRVWLDMARLEIQRQTQSDQPDWKRAGEYLDNAAKFNPKAVLEVTLLRAEVLLRRGEEGGAATLLEKARDSDPGEVEYWTALADISARGGAADEAEKVLRQAEKKLGDKVTLRLARARLLAARDSKLDSKEVRREVENLADGGERFGPDEQARLLNGLADILFRAGRAAEARKLWERLAVLPQQKGDLRLRLLLFDLAQKDGDDKRMEQALEDIRAAEQSGAFHRYGQALLLIWQVKNGKADAKTALGQARLELDRALAQRPSWPAVFVARAEIAGLKGDTGQAITDLQEAVRNGEMRPGVVRRLVALLEERGRHKEAQALLERMSRTLKANSDIGKLAVGVFLQNKKFANALELAREMVKDDSNNPQDLVWMGRVLAAARQPEEAELKLRKAVRLAGKDPIPCVALVQFLAERKRPKDALAVIEKVEPNLPADQKPLALARCYEALGDVEKTKQWFEAAYKAAANDAAVVRTVAGFHLSGGRLALAEPLLRKLADGEVRDATEADRAWARRGLATVLAGGTDFVRFKEALGLVGLKLEDDGRLAREDGATEENTEVLRTRARVLASQGQRQFRRRAIELYEDLAAKNVLTPDDKLVLAMLHDADGNAVKARQGLRELAQTLSHNPQYLAQFAMMLIVQHKQPGELAEADKLIRKLEKLEKDRGVEPNTFASVELRARLLEADLKGRESEELLREHAARKGARPEEILLVLGSLGRQKRFDRALTICEEVWKGEHGKVAPELIGGVSVALLRVMKEIKDSQVARVEEHLKKAIAEKPESTVLKMHLADLYDRRGRYAEAEAQYREVLKIEKNNVVALNNLAWMIAVRDGDAEEALRHINKAVNGIGRRPDLLDTRGLVNLRRKETEKAIADLKEAAAEAPTPTRLFHLAQAHHLAKQPTAARQALRQAKERGLEVATLHPVEQQACKELLEEYDIH
jgi:Tfp pilus assembly protein PilF